MKLNETKKNNSRKIKMLMCEIPCNSNVTLNLFYILLTTMRLSGVTYQIFLPSTYPQPC